VIFIMTDLTEDEKLQAFTSALEEVLVALLWPPTVPGTSDQDRVGARSKRRTATKKRTGRKSKSGRGSTKRKRAAR
jgi:hypothetical protein